MTACRFSMPATPLRQLKPELFQENEEELDVYDSEDDNTDFEASLPLNPNM